jgi:hypothetical protein
MSHRFVDEDGWTSASGDTGLDVRHVQPYQALKTYRCPGCDHEIRPGEGHEVVVPRDSPHDRRHWHTACWRRASQPRGSKQAAKKTAKAAKDARRQRKQDGKR